MPEQTDPAPGLAIAPYFQPPQGYFWRWAQGNEVVEWANGTTITYREELAALLTGLAPTGLPPLGAVLLLLAACNTGWQLNSAEIGLLRGLLRGLPPGGPPDEELTFHLRVAHRLLDIIRELPPELRQGVAKEHLLREVLGAGGAAGHTTTPQAEQLARDLPAYHETALIQPAGQLTREQVSTDLRCFDQAARRFPTVHGLELRLRTGLNELPAPLEATPAPPPPAEPAADLLAELAHDRQTAGLARLVPHLRAALHLPHAAPQASEQPLGGVADLSNRGPLDRLLLSELAQDDLSLLARLAHGEALYLRREAPPLPQPPPRVLLLDSTLPMWGLPRVAGLAAALALALAQPGSPEPPAAFALWSHHAQLLDLRSRAGVVAALGLLDPALHCGAALAAVLPTLPAKAEALLITEAQAARQPAFRAALAAAPAALRFLLTVARSGELVLYELKAGQRTVLSTSQIDLELLLNSSGHKAVKGSKSGQRPAFLRQPVAPLLFPAMRVGLQVLASRPRAELGIAAVTNDRRLLYWPDPERGAQELLPAVEAGEIHLSIDDVGAPDAGVAYDHLHLVLAQHPAGQAPHLLFHAIALSSLKSYRTDLSEHPALAAGWSQLRLVGEGLLALETPAGPRIFDCFNPAFKSIDQLPPAVELPKVPIAFLQHSYEVLHTLPHIGLSHSGQFRLGNYLLTVESTGILKLLPQPHNPNQKSKPTDAKAADIQQFITNKFVNFQRFTWRDGSEAFVDSRGLLHLRSADKKLPEVTLVLVADWPTAAWAADGKRCGSSYFTGSAPIDDAQALQVEEFYKAYLQPFIARLI